MRPIPPLCQVLCLLITMILHSTAAWQEHITAKQTVVNNSHCDVRIKLLEATIMKKLQVLLKNHTSLVTSHRTSDEVPSSCATLNNNATGSYSIRPAGAVEPFLVRCDFEDNFDHGGGWTVFLNRYDGSESFYRNWKTYKTGFGDVNGEHWLGLDKLHDMTKSGSHELMVVLEDFTGNTAYALYDIFKVGSESEKYELTVGNYSGTAGDSLSQHNGMLFSTFDRDNDEAKNCAKNFHGAWWFRACYFSHLNGRYFQRSERLSKGMTWMSWKGRNYSLKSAKMMFRRR